MLKQILRNEVRVVLGRNPTDEELKDFADYVYETYLDMSRKGKPDRLYITDIPALLNKYLEENYRECEECGEYYKIGSDDWNADGHYCIKCKPNQDPDMMPGGHDYY